LFFEISETKTKSQVELNEKNFLIKDPSLKGENFLMKDPSTGVKGKSIGKIVLILRK
jgi:hypothetical protein